MLRSIPLIFGAFEIGLYGDLVDFLIGEQGPLAALADTGEVGEYVEGETLFIFAYDWRRSNFANAQALGDFIEENIPDGQYDLIAHSMGGIVTRIMLSEAAPAPLCTDAGAMTSLGPEDLSRVCEAIYGSSPDGRWPSAGLGGSHSASARLHTFYEVAVPHYGSVNVASTLSEGWGLVTDILIGSQRNLQNIVLSMAAPWELVPTYTNCCARGAEGQAGRFAVPQPDPDYWLNGILAFGSPTCPYSDCALREAIARNGLENRAIIDSIMAEGLPATVQVNHGVIGRHVQETRETMYIAFNAGGDGDGLTFRIGSRGDGTVHEESALIPNGALTDPRVNQAYVARTGHGVISGDEQVTSYIYNTLINPIGGGVVAVSTKFITFAGGEVLDLGMEVSPNIVLAGMPFDLRLALTQEQDRPFDRDVAQDARPSVAFALNAASAPGQTATGAESGTPLELNADASLPNAGFFEYAGTGYVLENPGIYEITVSDSDEVLASRFIYVVEAEQ